MRYRIAKWAEYQHYKDRCPPWVKLHISLLSSRTWVTLDDASRVLAIASMLLASRTDKNGEFDGDPNYVMRVAYLNQTPNFKPLIQCGFLEVLADASNLLAKCTTETETETETETTLSGKPDVSQPQKDDPTPKDQARSLIDFLNEKAGKAFRHTDANLEPVIARLKEGYSLQDLKTVTVRKCREWAADERMAEYLRPATLYNRTKFNQYIGECVE